MCADPWVCDAPRDDEFVRRACEDLLTDSSEMDVDRRVFHEELPHEELEEQAEKSCFACSVAAACVRVPTEEDNRAAARRNTKGLLTKTPSPSSRVHFPYRSMICFLRYEMLES